jgi:hypothetical protein
VDDDSFETEGAGSAGAWRKNSLPFVTLVVVVGIICGLVLGGVVGGGGRREEPAAPATTVPTIQIQL